MSNTAGYVLSDNKIIYKSAVAEKTLFTISGIKKTSGLSLNGTVITASSDSLNNENVTISGDGYTLAMASGISEAQSTDAHFTFSDTTATYKSSSNSLHLYESSLSWTYPEAKEYGFKKNH